MLEENLVNDALFPRFTNRGTIEAVCRLWFSLLLSSFRGSRTAAPLKLVVLAEAELAGGPFPRFTNRGTIEATPLVNTDGGIVDFPRFTNRGTIEACWVQNSLMMPKSFPRFTNRGTIEA